MTPLDVLARVVAVLDSEKGNSLVNAYSLGDYRLDADEFLSELLVRIDAVECDRVELIIEQLELDDTALLDYALCVLDGEEVKTSAVQVIATNHALLGIEPPNYNVGSM